uniref:C2H2-type domain-containing protein n=1 Tax=Panagrolaimus sp. PS1159 TaxID=55785 RepID=A0AC35GNP0_9BILA
MATRRDYPFLNNKLQFFAIDNFDSDKQYSNLNLNQSYKCLASIPVQSFSKSNNKKCYDSIVFENNEKKEKSKSLEKSSNLCLNAFKLDSQIEEKSIERKWKKEDFSNAKNHSILSLHIAAYEKSFEAADFDSFDKSLKKGKFGSIKKQNFISTSKFVSQNPFEFQRQQNDNLPELVPEVSQFKASQHLLNPNEALNNGQGRIQIVVQQQQQTIYSTAGFQLLPLPLRQLADFNIVANLTQRNCPVCPKTFNHLYALRGHFVRVHLQHKRFVCNVCSAGFWSNSDLERHMPRHTGQRFICDACNRTYTSKQRLTEHFRNPSQCWLDPAMLKYIESVNKLDD